MSRGGRYGGGANKVGGQALPFDVDPALESEINAFRANDDKPAEDHARHFPPTKIPRAPQPSTRDILEMHYYRQHLAMRRASPYFLDDMNLGKEDPAKHDAFESAPTLGNLQQRRKRKTNSGIPDVRRLPIVWKHLPDELRPAGLKDSDGEDDDKVDVSWLTKKYKDPLAKFDDNEDDDDDDAEKRKDGDDDDEDDADDDASVVEELEDDDFEEDEDDADLDYNAENFFDNGEDDGEIDEAGDYDAWEYVNGGGPLVDGEYDDDDNKQTDFDDGLSDWSADVESEDSEDEY